MRIMVSTLAAILGISSLATAQQPWPNGYGSPYPQPYMHMQPQPYRQMPMQPMPAPNGQFYLPTSHGRGGFPYQPNNQAMTYSDPTEGGWDFNYTPINPLLPRRGGDAPPTFSSRPGWPNAGEPLQPGPSWPAPSTAREVKKRPAVDPNAEMVRMPVDFHRPTNECFWFNADYAMAFIRPVRSPVLVSTGPLSDPVPGALNQPGTQILLGGDGIDYHNFSGFRLNAGLFLDDSDCYSVELGVFYMAPNTKRYRFAADATGNPTFGRPVFVAADGINREGSLLTAFPGLFTGSLDIDAKAQLLGAEINARYHTYGYYRERLRMDGLVGFRFLRLTESLDFREELTPLARNQLTFLGARVNAPNSIRDEDHFRTSNSFFGPQIGARVGWEENWFVVDGFVKLALGGTNQNVIIDGSTTRVSPTGNQTVPGGLLALPSNIGNHSRTVFGIVPEFGANFGVNVTDHVRLKLGYSFLMWSNVVRPATQIDRNINPGQVPGAPNFGMTTGPAAPSFRFNEDFFWTHLLNVGVELHY